MRVIEAREDLPDEVDDAIARQPRLHQLAEAPALDQVHDHELAAALRLADIEHADDVGVAEPRGGLGLAAEPREHRPVAGEPLVQDLDRDVAPELDVAAAVHRPRRAGPELGLDHVAVHHDLADEVRPARLASHHPELGACTPSPGLAVVYHDR